MTRAALRLGALTLLLFAGCRGLPFPEPLLDDAYGKALKQEARTSAVYQRLETRIFARLVRLTPALVEAQCREISAARSESPAQAEERLARAREESAAPTYFAVVHTPEPGWNDWQLPGSSWHLALVEGEQQTQPASVTRLDGPFSPEQQVLLPYLDDFAVLYRIRFPAGARGELLRVSGVLGRMEFDWSAAK
jgi:hypothetical protein